MSLLDTVRAHGRHRLSPAELRQENRLLLAREVAAADFFALLIQDRDQVHACWRKAAEDRDIAEQLADTYAQQLAAAEARLTALEAFKANVTSVDVPPSVRDVHPDDQPTAPVNVRPLWAALGIGPVRAVTDPGQTAWGARRQAEEPAA